MTEIEKQKNEMRLSIKKILTSIILAIMAIAWLVSAIITILSDSIASKACYLGYKAHCSFTPFGTMISIIGFTVTFVIIWKINDLCYSIYRK